MNNNNKRERTESSRPFPKVPCQYGENCYRRNPDHFAVFSHQHLNDIVFKIFKNGKKNIPITAEQKEQFNLCNNEPIIPKHLIMTRDIIFEQIKVIRHLFPQHLIDIYDSAKKQKLLESKDEASTSTATSSTYIAKPSSTSMVDGKVNNATVTNDSASTSTATSTVTFIKPLSTTVLKKKVNYTSTATSLTHFAKPSSASFVSRKVHNATLTATSSTNSAKPSSASIVNRKVNNATVTNVSASTLTATSFTKFVKPSSISMVDRKVNNATVTKDSASTSTGTSSTIFAKPSSTTMVDRKVNNANVTNDGASTTTAVSSTNTAQPSSSTTSVVNKVDDEKVKDVTMTDAIASTSTAVPLTNTVVDKKVNDAKVSNVRARIAYKIKRNIHDYLPVVLPKGNMEKKLKAAAPYNFFLTTISSSPATHNEPLSVTLQEILDESLGVIEVSLQINFMIDIGWLLGHYYFANIIYKPLLVLYGEETPELKSISLKSPNVRAIKIQMPPFATHHTKMMLFGYTDGSMRVIISTANLYEDDWHNRTQGVWISPKLEKIRNSDREEFGESPTEFRIDLIRYLMAYNLSSLQPWIARIRKTNFSDVNVFLVASVPGSHHDNGGKGYNFGHAKVGNLLAKHCSPIDDKSSVVAQSSSIGTLGPNVDAWVINDIGMSFRKDKNSNECRGIPTFKMIYPSFENVKCSHDDILGGGCLPYTKKVHEKQLWLMDHLHQWKCGKRARSQAMPHIKTYCRWSKDLHLHWFMLTSANLSRAAWGSFNKNNNILPKLLRVNNYEVGVLFLPKFVINNDYFPMEAEQLQNVPIFPLPYDIPLTRFGAEDTPFFMDLLY